MEWWAILAALIGGIIVLLLTGLPVAFAFILVSLAGTFVFWGGEAGVRQFVLAAFSSVSSFILIALPLFFLMGELLMHSGIAVNILDAMGKWLGRIPGKLGLLAVAMGTLLSVLSGVSSASTAILGTTLTPEMVITSFSSSGAKTGISFDSTISRSSLNSSFSEKSPLYQNSAGFNSEARNLRPFK